MNNLMTKALNYSKEALGLEVKSLGGFSSAKQITNDVDYPYGLVALRFFMFRQKKQEEFLDNYLSIKGGDNNSVMDDKSVFFSMIENYTEVYGKSCFEVQLCMYINKVLGTGGKVSDALVHFFEKDVVTAFRSTAEGGQSSNAEFGIRQVIKNIKQQNEMKKAYSKKLKYGLMMFGLGLSFVIGVSNLALPSILPMINERDLDGMSMAYLHLSRFIESSGLKVVAVVVFVFGLFRYSLNNVTGDLRKTLEDFPIVGIFYQPYKAFSSNRFFNMLTLLKSTKISLTQCLEIIKRDVTPYLESHITEMQERTRHGAQDLKQLDTGLLTPRLRVRLKSAGKRTDGKIDEAFIEIASKASKDFESYMERIGDQLKTWLMICGVFMTVYSLLVIWNLTMAVMLTIK